MSTDNRTRVQKLLAVAKKTAARIDPKLAALRAVPAKRARSLLGEAQDEQARADRLYGLIHQQPTKKRSLRRVTLSEAVTMLAAGSASKLTQSRLRRRILDAVKDNRLRLHADSVAALGGLNEKQRQSARLKACARALAMVEWTKNRSATIDAVAEAVNKDQRLKNFEFSTVNRWIKDLKPGK